MWIVFAVVSLLVAIFIVVVNYPDKDKMKLDAHVAYSEFFGTTSTNLEADRSSCLELFKSKDGAGAAGLCLDRLAQREQSKFANERSAKEKADQSIEDDWVSTQIRFVGMRIGIWLGAVVSVFLLGRALNWIRSGTR
jgi:hypothetical protein